jgi:UDP-N-acetylglucosamine/UDP-N-acetylgalactosamine diphosphorylase
VQLLDRSLQAAHTLPFHIARKKVSHLLPDGSIDDPTEPNALKFEKFIFDLLPSAERPLVVEYPEQDCFAPLKNAPGAPKDTPEYVQQMLLAQHRRWLQAAGTKVAEDINIEISPHYALDAAQLAERLPPNQPFTKSHYLTKP